VPHLDSTPSSVLLCLSLAIACGGKDDVVILECGDGMGRADDGICYPLAGFDELGEPDTGLSTDGAGAGGDGASGSGNNGDGGAGAGDGSAGDGDAGDGGAGSGDGSTGGDDGGDGGAADEGGEAGTGSGGSSSGSGGVAITISGVINFEDATESTANCNISSWVGDAVDEGTGLPDRSTYSENDLQFVDCAGHGGGDIEYSLEILVDDTTEVAFFAFVDPDGDSSTPDFQTASESNPLTVVAGESYTGIDFIVSTD